MQIITAEQFRSSPIEGVDLMREESKTPSIDFRIRQDASRGIEFDQTLDRPPNADSATWKATGAIEDATVNAIRVRVAGPVIVVDVDGVRITYIDRDAHELDKNAGELTNGTDVLIVGPGRQQVADNDSSAPTSSRLVESKFLVLGSHDRRTVHWEHLGRSRRLPSCEGIAAHRAARTIAR